MTTTQAILGALGCLVLNFRGRCEGGERDAGSGQGKTHPAPRDRHAYGIIRGLG